MPNEDFGKPGGISYRDAGVDINAGSKLVDRIGPIVKATQNTDLQLSSIGGFAALTQLPAHYKQPVLVSVLVLSQLKPQLLFGLSQLP